MLAHDLLEARDGRVRRPEWFAVPEAVPPGEFGRPVHESLTAQPESNNFVVKQSKRVSQYGAPVPALLLMPRRRRLGSPGSRWVAPSFPGTSRVYSSRVRTRGLWATEGARTCRLGHLQRVRKETPGTVERKKMVPSCARDACARSRWTDQSLLGVPLSTPPPSSSSTRR